MFKIKSEGKENRPNPMEIYSKPVGYRNTEGFVNMLPTVEISTLSDKSYNELSEPEKQVYNFFRFCGRFFGRTFSKGKYK